MFGARRMAITVFEYFTRDDRGGSGARVYQPDVVTTHASEVGINPNTLIYDVVSTVDCFINSYFGADATTPTSADYYLRAGEVWTGRKATGHQGVVSDRTVRATAASAAEIAARAIAVGGPDLAAVAAAVAGEYETVAAGQTAQVLGATGGTGDVVSGLLVVPATTSPGQVLLLDNATSITVFTGGAGSVTSLVPFLIPLGIASVSGAWKVTTGSNVSVLAMGDFT